MHAWTLLISVILLVYFAIELRPTHFSHLGIRLYTHLAPPCIEDILLNPNYVTHTYSDQLIFLNE